MPILANSDGESTDSRVAYVDSDNILHAVSPGSATLTAIVTTAPDVRATINVTVTAVLYGDANDNNSVAIDDAVTEVMYILEQEPQPFSFKKADVNRDRKINIADVAETVDIILAQPAPSPAPGLIMNAAEENAQQYLHAENVVFDNEGHAMMTIAVELGDGFTAIQGDLILPEGVSVSGLTLADSQNAGHTADYAMTGDNSLRFVIYSLSLADVTAGTALLNISLDCDNTFTDGEALNTGIILVNGDGSSCNAGSFAIKMHNEATGVDGIADENTLCGNIFNLQGICLKRNATAEDVNALQPGLYIIAGKKVLVK